MTLSLRSTGVAMDKLLRISGGGNELRLLSRDGRVPEIVYWGASSTTKDADAIVAADRGIPHGGLDEGEHLDCFPEAGRGFNGHPALVARRDDGRFISQLQLVSARVDHQAHIELADKAFGVSVILNYAIDALTGVLTVATTVKNTGGDKLWLDWVAAAVLPSTLTELILFEGRWAREFQPVRTHLRTGLIAKENRTGRTSHHAPPFLIAGTRDFGESEGEVALLHLAWSGNHRLIAERLRDGRMQFQVGELFLPGEMVLEQGQTYEAPLVYAARSDIGLNGLSARLHPFLRETILGGRLNEKPRPVHFNTWEAVYFAHSQSAMMDLASHAAGVGVERFVVDDGWFIGRNDDKAGLGDWTTDFAKYPGGLAPLIEHVKSLGMEFGIWVEPEMANRNSELLRAHPDWTLGEAEQPLGRGQYVLDLSRAEVSDAIFAQLDKLLSEHDIAYLKWDMNRDLTHAISRGRPAAHAQNRAVYALIDRVRGAHPKVEIESCSSGGGRADYEILKRTDRIWTSDCNDPIERQEIQRGFSIMFPPEVMGSHIGPRQSHTTARTASLQLRALTALFGHMGIEGDVREFSEREREELRRWIAFYKDMRPLLHGGTTHRLTTQDKGLIAFMVLKDDALVSAAQIATPDFPMAPPLRLAGLLLDKRYRVRRINAPEGRRRSMKRLPLVATGETVTLSGFDLMQSGLALPMLHAGEIAVFHLEPEG
jgi:alpha-galactosidase